MAPSFMNLPWELREQIWDLVIRSDLPSAHFFSVVDRDEDSCPPEHYIQSPAPPFDDIPTTLAAPYPPGPRIDVQSSWSQGNLSIYMVDGGLWTACKESRQVIKKFFDEKRWRSSNENKKYRPSQPWYQNRLQHRLQHFYGDIEVLRSEAQTRRLQTLGISRNNERQNITIMPYRDLVCLQPRNILGLGSLTDLRDFWTSLNGRIVRWTPAHIALEFSPSWFDGWDDELSSDENFRKEGTTMNAIAKLLLELDYEGVKMLWFIDYSLQRKKRSQSEERSNSCGHVFYGRNCRFVEVKWEPLPPGMQPEFEAQTYSQAASFASMLEDSYEDELHEEYTGLSPLWDGDRRDRKPIPELGILACEWEEGSVSH